MINWQHQRVMTPEQFARAAERLNLSQAAIGRYLGVSERTANRYMKGQTPIPIPSAMLLWSLLHHKEKPVVPRWVSPLERVD